jgi:monoamine oxidase
MRTASFRALMRSLAVARLADARGTSSGDAIERWRTLPGARLRRRTFLKGLGAAAAAAAASPIRGIDAQSNVRVAIVGAGLAGLACADRLRQRGVTASVYEASSRPGGRCWSLPDTFPGQVVERGGELIDNLHKTMLGYARRYRLTLEDYEKQPGEVVYYFDGQKWPEPAVVDEYRAFVARMRRDLRTLSPEPTADVHQPGDVALDNMSLAEYLATRGAGRLVGKAIETAYVAEYGLEPGEQSALNFLLFIHADRRSRFMPFGVFSDERYHVVEGNDRIAHGLAGDLSSPVRYGHLLRRVRRGADGRIELTFATAGGSVAAAFDYVVLTLPFTVLRDVELAENLQLPPAKEQAIADLGYGTNAKMMVGFDGPFWRALGSSGASYSDLQHHQATWETNPTGATAVRAVLTDYSSGNRGASLDPRQVQVEAGRFLGDLERIFPGTGSHVTRTRNGYRAHLEHWPSNPLSKGSYTCYRPGQFTTIAGNEGKRVGNLLFAGEHTNSFYESQGFMEGACLSGLDAAGQLLADLKRR